MAWAPVIGLLLGAAAAAVLWVLPASTGTPGRCSAAVIAMAVLALLTRGLHLDGLADLADGLGSRQPAGDALAIMKRSDIGPFGVVALVLTLLVQVAALARAEALGRGVTAVIAAVGDRAAGADLGLPRGASRPRRAAGWARWWPAPCPPRCPVALSARQLAAAAAFGRFLAVASPRDWPSRPG